MAGEAYPTPTTRVKPSGRRDPQPELAEKPELFGDVAGLDHRRRTVGAAPPAAPGPPVGPGVAALPAAALRRRAAGAARSAPAALPPAAGAAARGRDLERLGERG